MAFDFWWAISFSNLPWGFSATSTTAAYVGRCTVFTMSGTVLYVWFVGFMMFDDKSKKWFVSYSLMVWLWISWPFNYKVSSIYTFANHTCKWFSRQSCILHLSNDAKRGYTAVCISYLIIMLISTQPPQSQLLPISGWKGHAEGQWWWISLLSNTYFSFGGSRHGPSLDGYVWRLLENVSLPSLKLT